MGILLNSLFAVSEKTSSHGEAALIALIGFIGVFVIIVVILGVLYLYKAIFQLKFFSKESEDERKAIKEKKLALKEEEKSLKIASISSISSDVLKPEVIEDEEVVAAITAAITFILNSESNNEGIDTEKQAPFRIRNIRRFN